jgi:CubicO group peptidase (beta-lactamase class C family)
MHQMTDSVQGGNYKNIDGILLAQKGKIVYEHYFNGYDRDSVHDTRSSFKSYTSLLLGIAIDNGLIKNVDVPVYTFFPENTAFAADPRKRKMTIRDLLEMRAGFDCDEWNGTKDCEDEMSETADWVGFSLALPMKDSPGHTWAYTSCSPMIISGIIARASGTTVMAFAKKYLFAPMGISKYRWTVDPSGNGMTAGSFYLLPSDMLKIGQMVINNGTYNGKRIVSAKWLKESTLGTIPIPDGFSFIKSSRAKNIVSHQAYYGYYWYNEKIQVGKMHYDAVFASGNGGQYIIMIKDLGLVVVFTQSNYGIWTAKRAFELLAQYIIPAAAANERRLK